MADEAIHRGLTKPERMKQLAEERKAQQLLSQAESEPELPPIDFTPELQKGFGIVLGLILAILVRLAIRRLL
jgi:hypothetical protein